MDGLSKGAQWGYRLIINSSCLTYTYELNLRRSGRDQKHPNYNKPTMKQHINIRIFINKCVARFR